MPFRAGAFDGAISIRYTDRKYGFLDFHTFTRQLVGYIVVYLVGQSEGYIFRVICISKMNLFRELVSGFQIERQLDTLFWAVCLSDLDILIELLVSNIYGQIHIRIISRIHYFYKYAFIYFTTKKICLDSNIRNMNLIPTHVDII